MVQPFDRIVIFQEPGGGGCPDVAFLMSAGVTVRRQVPASAVGGAAAATTRARTESSLFRPFLSTMRTTKVCLPGARNDVTSQFPLSPYTYGAWCSTQP